MAASGGLLARTGKSRASEQSGAFDCGLRVRTGRRPVLRLADETPVLKPCLLPGGCTKLTPLEPHPQSGSCLPGGPPCGRRSLGREPESPIELASSRCRRVVTVNNRDGCEPRPTVAAPAEVCDGSRGVAIEPARGNGGAADRTLKHQTGLDAEGLQPTPSAASTTKSPKVRLVGSPSSNSTARRVRSTIRHYVSGAPRMADM